MVVVNTNISALRSSEAMRQTESAMGDAMERLSTGSRINSASDDAAGSAIASKMEAQTRSLAVAVRNANDAISLTQTAEGALGEVEDILQRIRELAVQSGNSTLNASDRVQLQAEADALTAEIDAIASQTNFNSVSLFDGTNTSVSMQVGINARDTLSIALQKTDVASLGIGSSNTTRAITSERVTAFADTDADQIKINGENFASGDLTAATVPLNGINVDTSALASPTAAQDAGYTAAALAAAINTNSGTHGAVATAFNTVVGTSSSYTAASVTLNGVTIASQATKAEFVSAVNQSTAGVTATLSDAGVITLSNENGADINVGGGMTGMGFATDLYGGFITLANSDGSDVVIEAGSTENGYGDSADGTVAIVNRLGFNPISGTSVTSASVTSTDLTAVMGVEINGVAIGDSADSSALAKAAAINAAGAGVTATASTQVRVTVDITGTMANSATASINGITTNISAATNIEDVVSTVNTALSGNVDIIASSNDDGELVLTSASGLNIAIDDGTATDVFTAATMADGTSLTVTNGATTAYGVLTLTSDSGGVIKIEDGEVDTHTGLATLGLQAQSEKASETTSGLSMSTVAAASSALTAIDTAIETVSTFRAGFGATENRLDKAINNLTTYKVNLEAAKGRIEDADFASETAALTKSQILNQAATSMLAQANASKQNLLALLQ